MFLGSLDGHTDTRVCGSGSVVECYASSAFFSPLRNARFVLPFVYVLIPIRTGPYLLFFETSCSIYHTYCRSGRPPYSHSLISSRFILGACDKPSAYRRIYSVDRYYFHIIFSVCKTTNFYHFLFDSQALGFTYLHIPTGH